MQHPSRLSNSEWQNRIGKPLVDSALAAKVSSKEDLLKQLEYVVIANTGESLAKTGEHAGLETIASVFPTLIARFLDDPAREDDDSAYLTAEVQRIVFKSLKSCPELFDPQHNMWNREKLNRLLNDIYLRAACSRTRAKTSEQLDAKN